NALTGNSAVNQVVAKIGPRFPAIERLRISKHLRVSGCVAHSRRKVQRLPVVRLHAELFRGSTCPCTSMAEIIKICTARGVHVPQGRPVERARTGLVCTGVQRHAYVDQLSVGYSE